MPNPKSKRENEDLTQDVEALLEKVVLEEATEAVWQAFERILDTFDPQARVLIEKYFDGTSIQELSKSENVPEKDLEIVLKRLKREVTEGLRRGTSVRQ